MDQFAALKSLPGIVHGMIGRDLQYAPGVGAAISSAEREKFWSSQLQEKSLCWGDLVTASQCHGAGVGEVEEASPRSREWMLDGLITRQPGILVGVYVADCCPVYVVDERNRAVGIFHAGRRGAALGVVSRGIALMQKRYETVVEDLVVQLGPCIRRPHYEVDFAAQVVAQLVAMGVKRDRVVDCAINTAENLSQYYSYRMEKGNTGRMLAFIGIEKVQREEAL